MKKVLYFAALLFLATACEKEDIENTATVSMAGQWYVQVDAVDDNGNPINKGEDYYGEGRTILLTYNTAGNSGSEMPGFPTYAIKTKVTIDQNALTFKSTESENFGEGYEWWDEEVKLDAKGDTVWANDEKTEPEMVDVLLNAEKAMPVTIEGRILKGAGRQNNGSPADSIIMYVKYKDDPWVPDDGYTKYKISGIRYSGLEEND